MNVIDLFNPLQPIRGIFSKPSPSSLRLGEFAQLENLRSDDRTLYVRNGLTRLGTSQVPGTGELQVLGAASVKINGVSYLVAAYYRGNPDNYASVYSIDLSTGVFTEITPSDNGFGQNTRFTTNNPVSFAVITNRRANIISAWKNSGGGYTISYPGDVLLIQNGVELPRIWNPDHKDGTNTVPLTTIHEPIEIPEDFVPTIVARFGNSFKTSGTAMPTYTNSVGEFELSNLGTSPNNYIGLQIFTAVDLDDFAILDNGANVDINGKQLVFIYDTTYIAWHEFVRIDVSQDGSTYHTIYDPTDSLYTKTVIPVDDAGRYFLVAYPIGGLKTKISSVRYIKFIWKSSTPPDANQFVNFYNICFSGNVQGYSEFAITLYNTGTFAESNGVFLGTAVLDEARQRLAVQVAPELAPKHPARITTQNAGSRPLNGLKIPWSLDLYYVYEIGFPQPPSSLTNKGVDTFLVYMRAPGETYFTRTKFVLGTIASWVPATQQWSIPVAPGTIRKQSFNDDLANRYVDEIVPDSLTRVIPIAATITNASNRLFCGNILKDNVSTDRLRGEVWISQENHHFRFRPIVEYIDENTPRLTSATTFSLGNERIMKFLSVPSQIIGSNQIYIFTDQAVWSVEGIDALSLSKPTRIVSCGTLAPNSIASYKDYVWWVDTENQIREISPRGFSSPSLGVVEDKLKTAASKISYAASFFADILRIAYTPSGGTTNSRILLYDLRTDTFLEDVLPSGSGVSAEFLCVVENSNSLGLYAISLDGKVYRLEDPAASQDLNQDIAIKIVCGELHDNMWNKIAIRRIGIVCDDSPSSSPLTVTLKEKPGGTTATGQIKVDVAEEQAWRWSLTPSGGMMGIAGVSVQPIISGALKSGTNIYSIKAEVERRESGAGGG